MKHLSALLAGTALLAMSASGWAVESTKLPPELANPTVDAVECRERRGLPNFFAKLNQGAEIRIAYFGGSITAQEGWRPKTLKWFQNQYPKAKISQINAAIGGTGSDLGVFRCQQDVLAQKPDLVFVEFAVNDGGASPDQIYRCMEGIVRQTWKSNPNTDLCFVYTIAGNMLETLQGGKYPRSASAMDKLADFHGIPSIHMGLEVARLTQAGKVVFKAPTPKTAEEKKAMEGKILFSSDGVHPNENTGHQLYLEAVVRAMEKIKNIGKPAPHQLGEPFVSDHWEAAKIVPLAKAVKSAGWQKLPADHTLAKRFQNRLPELWQGKPGENLTFKFKGIAAGFFDLLGPDCGQLQITVDGQKPSKMLRFDSYCTYHRLGKSMAAQGLPNGSHIVKVEVTSEMPDKAKILEQRKEKIDKPERFEGLNWYVGSILLIGDVEN